MFHELIHACQPDTAFVDCSKPTSLAISPALGMRDLEFHASLIELALQAGNAARNYR
jgi:hypothetical protein